MKLRAHTRYMLSKYVSYFGILCGIVATVCIYTANVLMWQIFKHFLIWVTVERLVQSGLSEVYAALINYRTSGSYKWPLLQLILFFFQFEFNSYLEWGHSEISVLLTLGLFSTPHGQPYLAQQGWRIFGDVIVWSQQPSASSLYKIMYTSCQD